MKTLDPEYIEEAKFISQRARKVYIAAVYRPNINGLVRYVAQSTQPSRNNVVKLIKAISYVITTEEQFLKFVALDLSSLVYRCYRQIDVVMP